jgi:hypothetical protein
MIAKITMVKLFLCPSKYSAWRLSILTSTLDRGSGQLHSAAALLPSKETDKVIG